LRVNDIGIARIGKVFDLAGDAELQLHANANIPRDNGRRRGWDNISHGIRLRKRRRWIGNNSKFLGRFRDNILGCYIVFKIQRR
jgi:hypothetical protein